MIRGYLVLFQGFFPLPCWPIIRPHWLVDWAPLRWNESSKRAAPLSWHGNNIVGNVGNGGVILGGSRKHQLSPRLPNGPTDSSPRPNLWQIEELSKRMVSQTSTVSRFQKHGEDPFEGVGTRFKVAGLVHAASKKRVDIHGYMVIIWISWTNPFIAN